MPGFSVNYHELTQTESIRHQWLELQARASCSYFQSWGWIGSWLNHVVADEKVGILQVWSDQLLVGLGLFVESNSKRRLVIRSKALYLNEYLLDGKNMVIEYNGMLAAQDFEQVVYDETVKYLVDELKSYDEFIFGGISGDGVSPCIMNAIDSPVALDVLEESIAWQVEISSVHATIDQYLSSLSKNRRGQIKRSIRLYKEQGPLILHVAESFEEAMDYFKGLETLHSKRWQRQGNPGAFSNPIWKKFHTDLILRRFDEGEVQLIKVSNADRAIGYLYNFIWRKKIYVLQTGFEIHPDSRLMPGYVTHVLSIVHNYQLGMTEYDFLHGDALYKKTLSNRKRVLHWVVLQRPKLKFKFENLVLRCIRACRSFSLAGRQS